MISKTKIVGFLLFVSFLTLNCKNSVETEKIGAGFNNETQINQKESKSLIEKVKAKYDSVQRISGNGSIVKFVWILPAGNGVNIPSYFSALTKKEKLLFRINGRKNENFKFSWEKLEADRKSEISLPKSALNDPRKYMEDNLEKIVKENIEVNNDKVEKEGEIEADSSKVIVKSLKSGQENQVKDLEKGFNEFERQSAFNIVIATAFYNKNYESLEHYLNLDDLKIEKEEIFRQTDCYLLKGNSINKNPMGDGIYVKMWIGKDDLAIKKIESYNVVENAITLTQEILDNVVIQ